MITRHIKVGYPNFEILRKLSSVLEGNPFLKKLKMARGDKYVFLKFWESHLSLAEIVGTFVRIIFMWEKLLQQLGLPILKRMSP